MADEDPKDAKENPGEGKPDGDANPASKRTLLQLSADHIRKFITAGLGNRSPL
jgi:hypothetical protein